MKQPMLLRFTIILIGVALIFPSIPSRAADLKAPSGLKALSASWDAARSALVFFYKKMDEGTTEKQKRFNTIAEKLKDKADAYIMDINDPANKDVVEKYRLDRAPMPLVLVIAPNSAVTGGFTMNFREEDIAQAIVDPQTAQCLKVLQDRKFLFVCVKSDDAEANTSAMNGVTAFKSDPRFSKSTEVVVFDKINPNEQRILKELNVSKDLKEPLTVFMAPPGVLIGKFTGTTDKDQLLTALMNKRSSGGSCCGGGRSCGPRKAPKE